MDVGTAILAGIIATAVMTLLMYMGKAMDMPMDMPAMLGTMFARPGNTGAVYVLGLAIHFMMGAVFGIVYALLFESLAIDATWLWGAVFGAVHGMIAGMALGMMPMMHPNVGDGRVMPAPGAFGRNYGPMTPAGIIMLHIIFGALIGLIY